MSSTRERAQELGYTLPAPWPPGKFEPAVRVGTLVFTSGAGSNIQGKLGLDLDVAAGYEAAQQCCLQLLSNLEVVIGSLDQVTKIIKLLCMVNCTPDFAEQPAVANGCTDLLIELYGSKTGRHARSAVGMACLPGGSAVEIEMIVEVSS
jgi:enamine deaminase RidA (YjgF/YER057c/UK114 family)